MRKELKLMVKMMFRGLFINLIYSLHSSPLATGIMNSKLGLLISCPSAAGCW